MQSSFNSPHLPVQLHQSQCCSQLQSPHPQISPHFRSLNIFVKTKHFSILCSLYLDVLRCTAGLSLAVLCSMSVSSLLCSVTVCPVCYIGRLRVIREEENIVHCLVPSKAWSVLSSINHQTVSRRGCNSPPSKHFVWHTKIRASIELNTKSAHQSTGALATQQPKGFKAAIPSQSKIQILSSYRGIMGQLGASF